MKLSLQPILRRALLTSLAISSISLAADRYWTLDQKYINSPSSWPDEFKNKTFSGYTYTGLPVDHERYGTHYGTDGGSVISMVLVPKQSSALHYETKIIDSIFTYNTIQYQQNPGIKSGDTADVAGGAILSGSADLIEISDSTFSYNSVTIDVKDTKLTAWGGAVAHFSLTPNEEKTTLSSISNTSFTFNNVVSDYASYGGALAAGISYAKRAEDRGIVNNLNAIFQNNVSKVNANSTGVYDRAAGGAVALVAANSSTYIGGTYLHNLAWSATSADAYGGAIYFAMTHFNVISNAANFQNNRAQSEGGNAYGGAIYLGTELNLNSPVDFNLVTGLFTANTAQAKNFAYGGAISLENALGSTITGTFSGNLALGVNAAYGGAISISNWSDSAETVLTRTIKGTFASNTIGHYDDASADSTGSNLVTKGYGGAIYITNSKAIELLEGNFSSNTVKAMDGYGGAIALENQEIKTLSANSQNPAAFESNRVIGSNDVLRESGGGFLSLRLGSSINDLKGDFSKNSVSGAKSYGGAIHNYGGYISTDTLTPKNPNAITNITSRYFSENVVQSLTNGLGTIAAGGAIANIGNTRITNIFVSNSELGGLSGFVNNTASANSAYGGAIANMSLTNYYAASIIDIRTVFISNKAQSRGGVAMGGAIANSGNALIASIKADFTSNLAQAAGAERSAGGAIASFTESHLQKIEGIFTENKATQIGTGSSYGGAIFSEGSLISEVIDSQFIENEASAYHSAVGGAVASISTNTVGGDASIKSLEAIFSRNKATSNKESLGGGLAHIGTGIKLTGNAIIEADVVITDSDFYANKAIANPNRSSSHSDSIAYGGAVYNEGAAMILRHTDITGNSVEATGSALGAGIYNKDGLVSIQSSGVDVIISGNYAINYDANGRKSVTSSGIYNISTQEDNVSTIQLSVTRSSKITINDTIIGSTDGMERQIININDQRQHGQYYAGTVYLNNLVSNHKIDLRSGKLTLGSHLGHDVDDSYRAPGSSGRFENVSVAVHTTATLEASATALGVGNEISLVGGDLLLNEGTLSSNITLESGIDHVTLQEDLGAIIKTKGDIKLSDKTTITALEKEAYLRAQGNYSVIEGPLYVEDTTIDGGHLVARSGVEHFSIGYIGKLTNMEIIAEANSYMSLTLCGIGKGVSFSGDGSIELVQTTLTDLTVSKMQTRSADTNYSIEGVALGSAIVKNTLTFNAIFEDAEEFTNALNADGFIYLYVEGMTLTQANNASFYLDIGSGLDYELYDITQVDSALRFTLKSGSSIPEPSTATLSLLALASLLARRRRKTA